jgi:hypothetical protein
MPWKDVTKAFKSLLTDRPVEPSFGPVDDDQLPAPESLVAGASYLTITVARMQLEYSRLGWATYYPAVQSYVELSRYGANEITIPSIAGPEQLASEGARSASLVLVRDVPVLTATPYLGGPVRVAIGLFATKSNDYMNNLLSILESVSGVIGGASLTAALDVIEPLKAGVEALFGLNEDVALQVGVETSFEPVATGYYAIVDAPGLTSFRYRDGKLYSVNPDKGLTEVTQDHVVFKIGKVEHMDQWAKIPGLYAAQQKVIEAASSVKGLGSDEYRDHLGAFKVAVSGNADLVDRDRHDIIAGLIETAKRYAEGNAPVTTHAAKEPEEALQELAEVGRGISTP